MQKFKRLSILPLLALLLLAGCDGTPEEAKLLIGKWDLVSTQSDTDFYELEDPFTWEFREDGTYTIQNGAGKFEDAPFESTPFRASGDFTGQWRMTSTSLLEIREKYRDNMLLWVDEVSAEEFKLHFSPVEDDDDGDVHLLLVPAS